ncbi:MAG: dihydroneopterin aldolase [Bacteroidetes bacterium]|nr:dihydroneopterin aldolase [Bacteroidota bacterium]MBP7399649.1 dihydroneopterin aldolase [Chitinophagales bacterium]MBK7110504.1 dihydroneopterin aldolase [Bacteroidota bacterium]MBK8488268.1 dihydroneopterin aldolase [Bacteroidota bacterium]MBK8681970.1 dihydroneopterin aldolase [Bacteroidota bacterium]
MGKLLLEGMEFRAPVGVLQKEKLFGSRLMINVIVSGKGINGQNDYLADTIDYSIIYSIVKKCVMQPANLMEYVANNIINEIKKEFGNKLETINVQIKKINPPLDGVVESSGVEINWDADMLL